MSPAATACVESDNHTTTTEMRGVASSPRTTVAAWSSLLLAEEEHRLNGLRLAAEAAGWDPIPCDSVGQAVREIDRWRTQLAIVDMGSMPSLHKAAYLQFAARLASHDRLLVICDEPTDTEGELLARQAGAWLYVPAPEFGPGLTELLSEARDVAQKLSDPDAVST